MSASTTNYASVLRDASVMFETVVALALSLALLGVPLLSSGFGITASGSWHSVAIALVILAAAGYVFIQVVSDLFDKGSRILTPQNAYTKRWKQVLIAFLALLLCALLAYLKMRSDAGGVGM